jgi:peptidoglycan/LPS O-acetylase OafA/YrhL
MQGGRVSTLDGVRGLAALSVVFLHIISIFLSTDIPDYRPADTLYGVLSYTPLAAIWAGGQAVSLFFVLSGYALYSMLAARSMSYAAYATRRVVRLWIPYAAAIALAAASVYFLGSRPIANQSAWLNSFLGVTLTPRLLEQHALMLGFFNTKPLDFVIWSLVIEMRISLIFPAIYYFVVRFSWRPVLAGSLLLGGFALLMQRRQGGGDTSAWLTVASTTYFVLGALIARNRNALVQRYASLSVASKAAVVTAGLILYSNCLHASATYSTMVGSACIIWVSLSSHAARSFLTGRIVQFLGRISYSLYLVHAVVLLALINGLYPRYSFGTIAVLVLPLSLIAAVVMNAMIEQPAIRLSRLLSSWWTRSPDVAVRQVL